MPKHEEDNNNAAGSSSNSYVYPVRSLLTGVHAPMTSNAAASDSKDGPDAHHQKAPQRRLSTLQDRQGGEDAYEFSDASYKGKLPVNFRDFPGEDDNRLSFATNPLQNCNTSALDPPSSKIIEGPTGEPVPYIPDKSDSGFSVRPEPISAVAAVAMADGGYPASDTESSRSSIVNSGLVHLAPIRSEDINSSTSMLRAASGSREYRHGSTGGSLSSNSRVAAESVPSAPSSLRNDPSHHGAPSSVQSSENDAPLITYRFQHVQLGDGDHHVIIGREGKLSRCEDEVRFVSFFLLRWNIGHMLYLKAYSRTWRCSRIRRAHSN